MATLHNSVLIDAAPAAIWDAARDVGALHSRLVPGFVVKTELDGDARIVTFGNGMVAREPIISIDDERRRLAWSAEGGRTKHYNAVLQVFVQGSGSRVEWTTDLLPNEMAGPIQAMQEQALAIMKRTLEAESSLPLSPPLRAALARFSGATATQVHRLQLNVAELLLDHAPPSAASQLALARGFIEGRIGPGELQEARQDCWTHVGSLACGCSVADSASAHAIMTCLESDEGAHSPSGLVEQLERALRCGASESELLRVLAVAELD